MWWSDARRAAIALAAAALLAGCGFQPLYGPRDNAPAVTGEMAAIAISPIENRLGQMLRNELVDRLTPHGTPQNSRYQLNVTLNPKTTEHAFRKDDTATRALFSVTGSFSLLQGGKPIFSGPVNSSVPYDILDAHFTTIAAQRDAEQRTIRMMADDLTMRLSLYFTQK
ncbi:MAG: hypothetical protein K2Q10_10645 [Rhodospirillales bacterium]|nr:hypothetical protein [Rhodospirillales bacterium]